MIPQWLTMLSNVMLALGGLCALLIALDLMLGHRQHMWIMNIVWPVTALFGTVFAVWAYYKYGRLATRRKAMEAKARGEDPPNKTHTPFPAMVGKGATHCGSGCTQGDIAAEFLALFVPAVAVWLGWKSLFPETHHGKITQIAMLFGFATSYPVNWWLIKKGIKERM